MCLSPFRKPLNLWVDKPQRPTHGQCDRSTVTFLAVEYATVPWPVLVVRLAEGRRLSWPEWLATYQDGIHRMK